MALQVMSQTGGGWQLFFATSVGCFRSENFPKCELELGLIAFCELAAQRDVKFDVCVVDTFRGIVNHIEAVISGVSISSNIPYECG